MIEYQRMADFHWATSSVVDAHKLAEALKVVCQRPEVVLLPIISLVDDVESISIKDERITKQALRAGSAAREDEQIPRLVPRAAPAAPRLAVSACSRLFRKTAVGALESATALCQFPALAQSLVQTSASGRALRCTHLPRKEKPWLVESLFHSQPLL
jgi:hypothetical protein